MLAGWGEMTCRGELPSRRQPWAYDNGAFVDWRRGQRFNADAFEADMDRLPSLSNPDFIVVPDIVAGGPLSLGFSLAWRDMLDGLAPLYLAVQDGMTTEDVAPFVDDFAGLFVVGTLPWKLRTGTSWVSLAHAHERPCHIGRVGTMERVQWARRIGADSIDSCLPLWSEDNLARFVAGLEANQAELPLAPPPARGVGP
jgi:hypothetical protein